jgi:hypothetical protein
VVEDGAQELARVSVWVGLWAFVLEENHAARLGSTSHFVFIIISKKVQADFLN